MNIEQEARDVLNEISAKHGNAVKWTEADTRENSRVVEAVCRALETHNDVRAKLAQSEKALDAYRREVSDTMRIVKSFACGKTINGLIDPFIIPEPVEPLIETCKSAGEAISMGEWLEFVTELRAALAKIGRLIAALKEPT